MADDSDNPIAGGWNYRVMRRQYPEKKIVDGKAVDADGVYFEYGIYEVYYDADGNVTGWSKDSRPLVADHEEGLHWIHEKIGEALKKPLLDYD